MNVDEQHEHHKRRKWLFEARELLGRPLALAVFLASAGFLFFLHGSSTTNLTIEGIGWAPTIDHPALEAAQIDAVFVREGQLVKQGDLLLQLSWRDRSSPSLDELDAEIRLALARGRYDSERIRAEAAENDHEQRLELSSVKNVVQKARARAQRHRALVESARQELERITNDMNQGFVEVTTTWRAERILREEEASSLEASAGLNAELERLEAVLESDALTTSREVNLEAAQAELHREELRLLRLRRRRLESFENALKIRARQDGRIATIRSPGAMVQGGESVVQLVPEWASSVRAFVDPRDQMAFLPDHGDARDVTLAAGSLRCSGRMRIHRGAQVEALPGQLQASLWGRRDFGYPLIVDLADPCRIAIGRVVQMEIDAP